VIRRLLSEEPYRSRFHDGAPEVVDNLGTIVGAIAGGLGNGLDPERVFGTAPIRRGIEAHVHLRRDQGIGGAAEIREDACLRLEVGGFVGGLVGRPGFSAADARAVRRQIDDYLDALTRRIIGDCLPAPEPPNCPSLAGPATAPSKRRCEYRGLLSTGRKWVR
jgi:hypothetical protein